MCGIVGSSPAATPSRKPLCTAPPRASTTAAPTASATGSRPTAASASAMPASASSTSPPAISPSPARTSSTRIVVNGEFYGYEAIQRELEQRGHRLRTRSDSEIALHLYEDLGAALPAPSARRVRLRPLGRNQPHASSPRATASASSRSSTPVTTTRSISPPKSKRSSPPACPPAGTPNRVYHSVELRRTSDPHPLRRRPSRSRPATT